MAGLNALKAFIEAKCARPFLCADLKRVMEAAEIAVIANAQEEHETSGCLGCASPSPQREPASECLVQEDHGSESNSSTKMKLCFC